MGGDTPTPNSNARDALSRLPGDPTGGRAPQQQLVVVVLLLGAAFVGARSPPEPPRQPRAALAARRANSGPAGLGVRLGTDESSVSFGIAGQHRVLLGSSQNAACSGERLPGPVGPTSAPSPTPRARWGGPSARSPYAPGQPRKHARARAPTFLAPRIVFPNEAWDYQAPVRLGILSGTSAASPRPGTGVSPGIATPAAEVSARSRVTGHVPGAAGSLFRPA